MGRLRKALWMAAIALLLWSGAYLWFNFFAGAGSFKRMVTHTGIYAVPRPGGYDAVCFLDADSKDGGLSCLPCAAIGGCK